MADDDRGGAFYVMSDDYIDQKYVRPEEERQRQAEEDRRRREAEEKEALAEAERQRKAAEAERQRRKEESEHKERLERAKKLREEEEKRRKEQEGIYQGKLAKIEDEMAALERRKADFITEKLNLAKDHNTEETGIKSEIDMVLREKAEILDKEQGLRRKMDNFQNRARGERIALDQQEADANGRLRQLTQERRQIQTEMLNFLQQPLQSMAINEPNPQLSAPPASAPNYPSAPIPRQVPVPGPTGIPGGYGGVGMNPVGYQPQPQPINPNPAGFQAPPYNPNPATVGGPAPTAFNGPSYPTYPTNTTPRNNASAPTGPPPSVEIVGNNKSKDSLEEQLALVDDLLQQGVLSKEEHAANRLQALEAAGETEASYARKQNSSNIDSQLAQLDQYLRDGILSQTDYEDAKNRVLRDAGLLDDNGANNNASSGNNVPFAQIAPPTGTAGNVTVSVTLPPGKRTGEDMLINYNGKLFNVRVPPGVVTGQQFQVQVPAT